MYRFIFSIATFYNSFLRTNLTKKKALQVNLQS